MAETTEISWTDHTLNLWWGCAKVHAGCDHCYAEAFAHRYGHEIWGPKAPRKASKSAFKDVLKFQKKAAADGVVRRVFVGSMMDIFEKPFPLIDSKGAELPETTGHLRQRFFEEVVPACPNLLFLLLTKRPGNILKYIPEGWKTSPPANVMYGTSVVDQATADDMIPKLLEVPGRRFLSMEPLIGGVRLNGNAICPCGGNKGGIGTDSRGNEVEAPCCDDCGGSGWTGNRWLDSADIDWVIVGGESGIGARPMHPVWATSLRNECIATGTPFHFKQWGEFAAVAYTDGLGNAGYDGVLNGEPQTLEWAGAAKKVIQVPELVGDWYAHGAADGPIRDYPINQKRMLNVGKKLAGNYLHGKLYQDVPTIEPAPPHLL